MTNGTRMLAAKLSEMRRRYERPKHSSFSDAKRAQLMDPTPCPPLKIVGTSALILLRRLPDCQSEFGRNLP